MTGHMGTWAVMRLVPVVPEASGGNEAEGQLAVHGVSRSSVSTAWIRCE
jgi:hypothetical protein